MAFAVASWPSFFYDGSFGPHRLEMSPARVAAADLLPCLCPRRRAPRRRVIPAVQRAAGCACQPSSRRTSPPSFSAKRSAPWRASSSTNKRKSKIPLDSQITMSFVLYRIGSVQDCPGCSGTRKITESATPMRNSILKIRVIAYFVLDRRRQNDIKPNDFERDRNNGEPFSDAGRF